MSHGGDDYSFIRHLAWSLLLNHDPKRCLVKTFTAHYDASGSEGDKEGVLVVVGLVAHEYQWLRFERDWNAVLDKFRVPYYHRRELGDRHKGKGIYGKWADDDITPRRFSLALLKVLRRRITKPFCYGLILEDYWEVNKLYRLKEGIGSPYVLTAGSCYDAVNNWGKKKYPHDRSIHIFEAGDVGQKNMLSLAKRVGQNPLTKPKVDDKTGEWFLPFQGADLLAGAWRRAAVMRKHVADMEDYGEEFNEIARRFAEEPAKLHHRQTLIAGCRANPDKCPRRT